MLGPYEILIVDEDDDDIPQSDWNQNDPTALDYVKNRTHWSEKSIRAVCSGTFEGDYYDIGIDNIQNMPHPGDTCHIVFDSIEYDCIATLHELGDLIFIGNEEYFMNTNPSASDMPFLFVIHEDANYVWINCDSGTHTFSIEVTHETIHHLDPKYIKDMYYDSGTTEKLLIDNLEAGDDYPNIAFVSGDEYKVIWNTEEYECICVEESRGRILKLTNGETPFYICDNFCDMNPYTQITVEYSNNSDAGWIVSIIHLQQNLQKIDKKYLPNELVSSVNNKIGDVNLVASDVNAVSLYFDKEQNTILWTQDNITDGRSYFVYNAYSYYKVAELPYDYGNDITYLSCNIVRTRFNSTGTYNYDDNIEKENFYIGENCFKPDFGLIVVQSAGNCRVDGISFYASSPGIYTVYDVESNGYGDWCDSFSLTYEVIKQEYMEEMSMNTSNGIHKIATTIDLDVKQDKITGTPGQFVVIGDDGNVTTKTVPNAEEVAF